jgi:hypothetical protein
MVAHLVYININLFHMFHYIVFNIIYIFVCAIFADIIIHVCVLFVGRGQSTSCDNKYCKIQSPWPIGVLYDYFLVGRILGSVTCAPLQNLCKQKRSVSRHFLFVGRGQSISCDNFLSNPIAVLFAIKWY